LEDRSTPGLYVELCDVDPGDYRAHRAPELLERPGVERVSWWRTCVPGRRELPMTVADGTLLGLAEVGPDFTTPEVPPGTTARHFVRHRRPSQGVLTGEPTLGLLVVWISPRTPDRAASVRDWGDFVHIRHIAAAAVPGFTQVAVYENTAPGDPRWMHFYELDVEDTDGAYQHMARHMARYFGGSRTEEFARWADYGAPGGELHYCNTFNRLGHLEGARA